MIYVIFIVSLIGLIVSAQLLTKAAEKIGVFLGLPSFVVGVFIVGIGTSLPELISGIISVSNNSSEILAGNIIGSNISNILLITGLAVVINRNNISLRSGYMYIDLHFLLGGFLFFYVIASDGRIELLESLFGLGMYIIYSVYLIKGETTRIDTRKSQEKQIPYAAILVLVISATAIYFGADYTIWSLEKIAAELAVPQALVALTLLSLGTTLPELAVNISAIRQGKAEMAIGNVLGSSIFNTIAIPSFAAFFGDITVPENLIQFSLPFMAACGIFFYLLTQDKKISVWEGLLFICMYALFIFKTATS